ncbi:hypothetical protein B7486_51765 [cyanobacterium TDX16]|nr:hypothetical protein B7486_51765 [cyanobacterium TDX16]
MSRDGRLGRNGMTTTTEPVRAEAIAGDSTTPTDPMDWSELADRFAEAQTIWITTVSQDGRPSSRPIFSVWLDGALHFTTNPTARKAQDIAATGACTVSVTADEMDLVIEGVAEPVADEELLQRIADAYVEKYGWPVTVVDGAFDAPFGAPSAGPPPYLPHVLTSQRAYAFGTTETWAPRTTRFTF